MTQTARIRTLLLALIAMLTLFAGPAFADDDDQRANGAKDNEAVAEASGAGDSVIDLAFAVRETASDVVDETNTAVAYANCEACRAVAIAFQIVIVQGDPGTVTPQNVAVAVNNECPDCSTLAIAYQFVVGRGEPVEFTERGLKRLAAIAKQLKKLEKDYENLTNEEILARTETYAEEVRDILAKDLVPVDRDDDDDDDDKRGPPVDRENQDEDDRGDPAATTTTPVQPTPTDPPVTTQTPAPTQTTPPPPQTSTTPAPEPVEDPPPPPATTTPAP